MIIVTLCAVSVLGALQYMLLVPILPILPQELNASPTNVQWLITGSVLAGTVGTPILTRLADMRGRKALLQVNLIAIVAGSILALFAENLWLLVVARAITGLSMAAVPIGIAVIRTQVPLERRTVGIGLVSTTGTVGVGIGLPIGGVMDALFGWRSVFALMLVFAIILIILVHFVVPVDTERIGGTFDIIGSVMLTAALVSGLVGVSQGVAWGWTSWQVTSLIGVSILLGIAWFAYERRIPFPVIDVRVSASRALIVANIVSVAIGVTVFGNILVMTSQLQVPADAGGFGLSAIMASVMLSIPAITIMFTGAGASLIVSRIGARNLLIIGGVLSAVGYGARWVILDNLFAIVLSAVIIQIGSSACLAAIPVIVTGSVPVEDTASANGVNNLIRSVGSTLASATIAAAFTLTAVSPSGIVYPSEFAFHIIFMIVTFCGVAITVGALWIPRDSVLRI